MMTSKAASAASGARGTRARLVLMGMVLTLLAAIGLSAWAQTAPSASQPAPGAYHGYRHGGMGGPGMMGGSPEHMGRMIDHLLNGVNASDAQRDQIKQIVAQAAADMKGQAAAARDLHRRGMEIFTSPVVDANAAEQVRLQTMQLHDQMSRRMTQALVAVAGVLTPEQRQQLGARMKDRHARMEEGMKQKEQDGSRR